METGKLHTLTTDNGREFSAHCQVAKELNLSFYFADPYSSWQRGLNENTNGLIRQYLPQKSAFTILNDADVQFIEHQLNHRPRKTLGYKTPAEVFFNNSI